MAARIPSKSLRDLAAMHRDDQDHADAASVHRDEAWKTSGALRRAHQRLAAKHERAGGR
jgi:hypothetical protein